jgi:hypothetical protein
VRRNLYAILCILAIPIFSASAVHGVAVEDREHEIKAAYIYNLAKFVEWPATNESAQSTFTIGILGNDPFGSMIDNVIIDKTVKGKRIIIERFPDIDAMRRSGHAINIVFIGDVGAGGLEAALEYLGDLSVLTIGETSGFCEKGGIVNLLIRKNRIRIEINRAAAEHAKLRISSKLLQLASKPGEKE